MKTIKVYTPSELKKKNPEAFEKAWERFRNNETEIFWSDEIMESFKAIFKASGIHLINYEICGDYPSQSTVRFEFNSSNDIEDLKGNRALAWLENNLLSDLRIPQIPMFTRFMLPNGEITEYQVTERGDLAQYGQYYRAGMIKPCPFTGYCADDDFIESLIKDIKSGSTLYEAYSNLADLAGKMFESEIEYQNSEEYFLEQDYEFTIDGRMV